MSDQGPWNDYAAPTALPPSMVPSDTKPWEDYSPPQINLPKPPQPQSTMGMIGQAASDAFTVPAKAAADLATNPVTMAHALPLVAAGAGTFLGPGGTTAGNVGGNLVADAALSAMGKNDQIPSVSGQVAQGILSGASELIPALVKVPESLKSAGINATTLEHMAPGGQAPGDYASAVESQLKSKGVLADTANGTWKLMNDAKDKAGSAIGNLLQKIKSASSAISDKFGGVLDPTVVDAETALQPLAEQAQKIGNGVYSEGQIFAKPFQEANDALAQMAQKQGGKLTLDNVKSVMGQTGAMMNKGEEAVSKYGPVYGKLADVWDGMIHTISQQSGDTGLGSDLLKQNADYSTYMRLLPTIEKAGYREAVRAGVSAFQKYGGPLVTKVAAGVGVYDELKKAVGKVIGE